MSQLTYQILAPLPTHWRPASCADVDCGAYLRGWRTTVDERTPLGQEQAAYIRRHAGRRYVEERTETGLTAFTFEAGQMCFAAADHRVPLGREQVFRVAPTQGGRLAGEIVTHQRAADWVDDFASHLDHIRTMRERG